MDREKEQLKEFVVLPTKAARGTNVKVSRQYAKMGFIPGGLLEQNKVRAELPEGWKIDYEEGAIWRKLIDNKGRVRARYFLSASTDKSFIAFCCRYGYDIRPFDNYGDETVTDAQRQFNNWFGVILDCGEEIARTEPYKPQNEEGYRRVMPEVLRQRCEEYLQEHYLEHKDINAYWD